MNKLVKRLLITVLVIAGIGGGVYGGMILLRNARKQPVNVYPAQNFAMQGYWGDSSETYGSVKLDKMQNVFLTDTQVIHSIYVAEGQEVKVGDPLIEFDTTLSDIDLEKARINLQRLQLNKDNAERELKAIKNMSPMSTVLITPQSLGIVYDSQPTPMYVSGSGTEMDPLYILWGENDVLSADYIMSLFPEPVPEPEPTEPVEGAEGAEPEPAEPRNYNEVYIALVNRYNDALNAKVMNTYGIYANKESGKLVFRFVDTVLSEQILAYEAEPESYYQQFGSPYTSAELAKMRAEKEEQIQTLTLDIQVAEVELKRLEQEVNDGIVYSKIDGVVKTVNDPETAITEGKPLMVVSGGGGYYIDVAMSELELDSMSIGQTVTVNSWQSGMTYEGTIVAVSEYPTRNADSWSDGNTNVSYYPFTVFVDEDAELMEYEYVSISYQSQQQDDNALYIETMFVRNDGAKSYVYVQNAEGKLEKRTVQTGKNLWGSYIQIRGGITIDDNIAFPYGKDVEEGAATVVAGPEELYGFFY